MALADNLTSLKTDVATAYRTKMEAKFNLTANPDYISTELQKAGDVIAEIVAEFVMPYIKDNAELDGAALADTDVTASGSDYDVTNPEVEGGIK